VVLLKYINYIRFLLFLVKLPGSAGNIATLIALESPAFAQCTLVPLKITVQTVEPLRLTSKLV
jgi:hypothetical protein